MQNQLGQGGYQSPNAIVEVAVETQPESRIVLHSEPDSLAADRYRLVRVYLTSLWSRKKIRRVMVASAMPGEGKSTSAINLAFALAERSETRVVLVEADLRQPVVGERLGLPSGPGLLHCLRDGLEPMKAVRRLQHGGLYVLSAGETTSNPIDLLNSERFASVLNELAAVFDWLIIDVPAIVSVPDGLAIRLHCDACLWVTRANRTPKELVRSTIQQFGEDIVIGLLLNDVKQQEDRYAYYYASSKSDS
jgi:capsular exopolysaccharide synthesis family protein